MGNIEIFIILIIFIQLFTIFFFGFYIKELFKAVDSIKKQQPSQNNNQWIVKETKKYK